MASHPSWIFDIEILLPDSTGAFQFGERLPETILGTQLCFCFLYWHGMSGGAKCCRDGIGIHQAGRMLMRFPSFSGHRATMHPALQVKTYMLNIWLYD